jgi:hypothetical protein
MIRHKSAGELQARRFSKKAFEAYSDGSYTVVKLPLYDGLHVFDAWTGEGILEDASLDTVNKFFEDVRDTWDEDEEE